MANWKTQLIRQIGAWRRGLRHARLERLNAPSGLGGSAWALYGLVRAMQPNVCVEIGSAHGRSACFIGAALRDNGRGVLYAIDPHEATAWNDDGPVDTLAALRRNLRHIGVERHVTVVRQRSQAAAEGWTQPIDLLFIDGDHSYRGVQRDWELFSRFVSPWGMVVFHDTLWDVGSNMPAPRGDMGVPQFVDELRAAGYPVLTWARDFGVSVVQPTPGGVPLALPASVGV